MAPLVVGISNTFNMLPSIKLYNQADLQTGEIGEIRSDRMLSPKFQTQKLAISQAQPQNSLSVG